MTIAPETTIAIYEDTIFEDLATFISQGLSTKAQKTYKRL
jgi:hypothetical protein